jgi:hypothetical protein
MSLHRQSKLRSKMGPNCPPAALWAMSAPVQEVFDTFTQYFRYQKQFKITDRSGRDVNRPSPHLWGLSLISLDASWRCGNYAFPSTQRFIQSRASAQRIYLDSVITLLCPCPLLKKLHVVPGVGAESLAWCLLRLMLTLLAAND